MIAMFHTKFIWLYFKRENTWDEALNLSAGATPTSRNRLKEQHFLNFEIPLPPLAEQRRIVARIEELTSQINEARTFQKQAEIEEQRMLAAAFVSITGGIKRQSLGDAAPIIRRAVKIEAAADYPELGIRSFGKGTFHKPPINGLSLGTKRLFQIYPGDLVFNNVFAWEGAVAVAQPEDDERFGSHRFITCAPKAGLCTSNFLCFFFLTKEGLSLLGEASPGGAGRNRTLGVEALMRIPVPLSEYHAQIWFDNLQAEVSSLKRVHTETTTELDALVPSILDKAFKGGL
jgi:type I restriction enzyme S subunit